MEIRSGIQGDVIDQSFVIVAAAGAAVGVGSRWDTTTAVAAANAKKI